MSFFSMVRSAGSGTDIEGKIQGSCSHVKLIGLCVNVDVHLYVRRPT